MRCIWPAFLALVFLSRFAAAQEFSYLVGHTELTNTIDSSYGWEIDYRQPLHRYFGVSFSWINEGHPGEHHRDGWSPRLWAQTTFFDGRLRVAGGVGYYRYFDTQPGPGGQSQDVHGGATIVSGAATYYWRARWLIRFEMNRITAAHDVNTNSYMLGLGYRFLQTRLEGPPRARAPRQASPPVTTDNEAMLFAGRTVVNTFESQKSFARGAEFRRGVGKYWDWTLSWINEGDPRIIRRNGVASQAWLVRAFAREKVALGVGGGAYYYIDTKHQPAPGEQGHRALAGLVTLTASYRLSDHWFTRLNWNRVVTNYNRDSDVIVIGAGLRWGR